MSGVRSLVALLTGAVLCLTTISCSDPTRSGPDTRPVRVVDRGGLLSDINEELSLFEGHETLRAVLVHVGGRPFVEEYLDWPKASYLSIGSITVPVVTSLVGIAIGEGLISGVDESLAELLPEHRGEMRADVARTTLHDLLTMSGGMASSYRDPPAGFTDVSDPTAGILQAADNPPGKYFDYSNQGAHLLSAVLAEATGMPVLDYARTRLFDPLGIDTRPAYQGRAVPADVAAYSKAGFAWPVDATGLNTGWDHLKLRPGDLVKLGQLYLDKGTWHGRQLIPRAWVAQATSPQRTDLGPDADFVGANGWGYGWWTAEVDGAPAWISGGENGQLLEVLPSRSLVVVVASESDPLNREIAVTPGNLAFMVAHDVAPKFAP